MFVLWTRNSFPACLHTHLFFEGFGDGETLLGVQEFRVKGAEGEKEEEPEAENQ